jgi:hypothetical protein
MRTGMWRSLHIALLLLLLSASIPGHALETRTVVVSFASEGSLGQAVATIFQMQLSSSLRKQPVPNPLRLDFGIGLVIWQLDPTFEPSHDAAEKIARQINVTAQHVLWGSVHEVGNSAVVTTYLTLPKYFDFRPTRNEEWILSIRSKDKIYRLEVDVPQRYYAFEPVNLSKEFIRNYSTPDQLTLVTAPGSTKPIGMLGNEWTFLRHDGQYSQVRVKDKVGWVFLPDLSQNKPEIIDFTSGIIRTYRGDWRGTVDVLKSVVNNAGAAKSIQIDALMFMVRAKSELGEDASPEIGALRKMAPASKRAIQYIAMYEFARCYSEQGRCSDARKGELSALLRKVKPLFSEKDEWYQQASSIARSEPQTCGAEQC